MAYQFLYFSYTCMFSILPCKGGLSFYSPRAPRSAAPRPATRAVAIVPEIF